jgi:hypothetical protein
MRKPSFDADRDIFEGMVDAREERIARRARIMKKARELVAKFVKF